MDSLCQERMERFATRLQHAIDRLDLLEGAPNRERDFQAAALLVEAAEYASIACDLSDTSSILSSLIIDKDLEGLSAESLGPPNESLVLLGIGIPATGRATALAQVARFFEALERDASPDELDEAHPHHKHPHDHSVRACASPDIDALFSDADKKEPAATDGSTTDGAQNGGDKTGKPDQIKVKQPKDAAQIPQGIAGTIVTPQSTDPVKGVAEAAVTVFDHAEKLLCQAEELLSEGAQA